jgi:hypothetical protein
MVISLSPKVDIENKYYEWLCNFVGVNQKNKSYYLLFKELYKTPFKWTVPNDDNRAVEGMELRRRFCEEEHYPYKYAIAMSEELKGKINILEVLIALAVRCDELMKDTKFSANIEHWFWHLLDNIDLSKFTDEEFYTHFGVSEIEKILNIWINRQYKRNGEGGLFPIKDTKKDQRKVELWYQMSEYLVKNYYIR